jgi:hypothetical protein
MSFLALNSQVADASVTMHEMPIATTAKQMAFRQAMAFPFLGRRVRRFGVHAVDHFNGNSVCLAHARPVLLGHVTIGGSKRRRTQQKPQDDQYTFFVLRGAAPAQAILILAISVQYPAY